MKGLVYRLGSMIASLALAVTAMNINVACTWILHQPRVPEGAKKLRKF